MTSKFRFPENWQEILVVNENWWKNLSYKNISSSNLADCFLHITRLCLENYRHIGGEQRAFEVARCFHKVFSNNYRFSRNFNETFNHFELFNVTFDIYIQKLEKEKTNNIDTKTHHGEDKKGSMGLGITRVNTNSDIGVGELDFLVNHFNNRQLYFTRKYLTYALLSDHFLELLSTPPREKEDMENLFSLISFFYGSKLISSEDITQALLRANYKEKSFLKEKSNKNSNAMHSTLNSSFLIWLICKANTVFRQSAFPGKSLLSSIVYFHNPNDQDKAFFDLEVKKLGHQVDVVNAMVDYVAISYTTQEVIKAESDSGTFLEGNVFREIYDKALYKRKVLNEKATIHTYLGDCDSIGVDKSKFKI